MHGMHHATTLKMLPARQAQQPPILSLIQHSLVKQLLVLLLLLAVMLCHAGLQEG